jgi:hypothetical protein
MFVYLHVISTSYILYYMLHCNLLQQAIVACYDTAPRKAILRATYTTYYYILILVYYFTSTLCFARSSNNLESSNIFACT